MSPDYQASYSRAKIISALSRYFDREVVGGSGHEPTREVWRLTPWNVRERTAGAVRTSGAGGATKAFEAFGGRRMDEIESVLGVRPLPGSMNLTVDGVFDWASHYYRARILDVTDRRNPSAGWALRWCRFYPVTMNETRAWAMRFEGESYPTNFVELISDARLNDKADGKAEVVLCR